MSNSETEPKLIYKGVDFTLNFKLRAGIDPYPLTNATEILVKFPGGFVASLVNDKVKFTNRDWGDFKVVGTALDADQLELGTKQTVGIWITIDGDTDYYEVPKVFTVVSPSI